MSASISHYSHYARDFARYPFDGNEIGSGNVTLAPSFYPIDPMDEEFFEQANKIEQVCLILHTFNSTLC
jgi:hypothetical protein